MTSLSYRPQNIQPSQGFSIRQPVQPNQMFIQNSQPQRYPNTNNLSNVPPPINYPKQMPMPNFPQVSPTNVQELSHDLMRLKQQLKKLAERGEDISTPRHKLNEEDFSQTQNRNKSSSKFNMSADCHQFKRQQTNNTVQFYPSITNPVNQFSVQNQKTQEEKSKTIFSFQQPPSKREKIDSFMYTKQQKPRIAPIMNPNKREQARINDNYETDRIRADLKFELEIKQLKQKIGSLQNDLGISRLEKQNLAIELRSQKSKNERLRQQLKSQNKSETYFQTPTKSQQKLEHQREQRRANMIIEKLQAEINHLKSMKLSTFDDALKTHLQDNKQLRLKIEEKNEQIEKFRDQLFQQRKINDDLKGDLVVLEMKASSELRSCEQKLEVQYNDKCNELQTAKHTLQTLDLKYKTALKQIKEKDQFIMNYLVGRSKEVDKEEVRKVLEKYQFIFPTNRIMDDLLKEQREIEELRREIKRVNPQFN